MIFSEKAMEKKEYHVVNKIMVEIFNFYHFALVITFVLLACLKTKLSILKYSKNEKFEKFTVIFFDDEMLCTNSCTN